MGRGGRHFALHAGQPTCFVELGDGDVARMGTERPAEADLVSH